MKLTDLDLVSVLYVCRHLRAADVAELSATRYGDMSPDQLAIEVVTSWATSGHAWIVRDTDGTPVAVFGAAQPWPGVWSAWMIATDAFPRVGMALTKFVKRVFIPHMKTTGRAHRIEARSMVGHEMARRWLETLGAGVEGTLKAYGRGGEDFRVWTLPLEAVSVDNRGALSTADPPAGAP